MHERELQKARRAMRQERQAMRGPVMGPPPEWDEADAREEYIEQMLPDRIEGIACDPRRAEELVEGLADYPEARDAILCMIAKRPEDRTPEEAVLVRDWYDVAERTALDELERETL